MRRRSFGSARAFFIDPPRIIEALRAAAARAVDSEPMIARIVLFGSLPRGDAVPGSDADLLVVLRGNQRPTEEQRRAVEDHFSGCGVPPQLVFFNERQVAERTAEGDPFLPQTPALLGPLNSGFLCRFACRLDRWRTAPCVRSQPRQSSACC